MPALAPEGADRTLGPSAQTQLFRVHCPLECTTVPLLAWLLWEITNSARPNKRVVEEGRTQNLGASLYDAAYDNSASPRPSLWRKVVFANLNMYSKADST